eukprot:6184309-Pleurochrysis_carterae.AAC.3
MSVTARNTGQARFKCPEPVPARAATSFNYSAHTQTYEVISCSDFIDFWARTIAGSVNFIDRP